MLIDVRGKITEKKLAYNNTLLPLFEAVVNSIHAIQEDTSLKPGIIEVQLVRTERIDTELFEKAKDPISGFTIVDNGSGFHDANFASFNRAHSTYKLEKGGKGVGRFIWLKAFDKVEIESVYKKNGQLLFRHFFFEPTENGIEKLVEEKAGLGMSRKTVVKLVQMKSDYQKWCNNNPEEIAFQIIEHCFVYFLGKNCPRIKIIDGIQEFWINDLFKIFTKGKVLSSLVVINSQKFKIYLVKLYDSRLDNKIHYCAHTREVQNEKLNLIIPELDGFLVDDSGEPFSIAAYVSGKFLDENVNEERTQISFLKSLENRLQFPDEVAQDEIREAVAEVIKSSFSEIIDKLSDQRIKKVQEFVSRHPRYRQLLKYRKGDLRKIPSTLSDEKMELELFKIQQKLDLEVKIDANEILKEIDSVSDMKSFASDHAELYNKIIEVGNSKLSEYVLHRKLVLDLLEKHIQVGIDQKFSTEDTVHKLIFPLRSFSDDIGFEDHNLWVIDEKLAFHNYLASDKQFKQIEVLESDSSQRPDLIIFNKPFAFSENSKPYSSIVLVEFKRPMREDYSDEENPISQIMRYAREITENSVEDKNKRSFDLRPNTPMYAYIICDLTIKLRQYAKDAGFTLLPDNDGYFSYNSNYSIYIEILSFDKLIRDSKMRNKALFEKLNLTIQIN